MNPLPQELYMLIEQGEGLTVEFKRAENGIPKTVYQSVCAFANRDGGHIFLGVSDDGTILGIEPDCINGLKRRFSATINNPVQISPALYLVPEEYEYNGHIILYIHVPVGASVYRCAGKIYDRNHESDIDITENIDMVRSLYEKKTSTYFVNKVYPAIPMSALRSDLLARARRMTRATEDHHVWLDMTDEEMLRHSGLLLDDPQTGKSGITLAAILLFGTDSAIMSVLPQHKTDAIFRVFNMDRYDDRDVITTNLLESYDRLITFGQKHLNDLFVTEGIQRVSARDKILREIVSNLLMHRDFSSGYVAKFLIERDKITTDNANLANGHSNLNIHTFKPFTKNPPIAKIFREIGLADELGSGMRNSYKYTGLYSGGEPQFIEGTVFSIVIPLSAAATATVGTSVYKDGQEDVQVYDRIPIERTVLARLLDFCRTPKSAAQMQDFIAPISRQTLRNRVLRPCLKHGLLHMTVPDKPTSSRQKYVSELHTLPALVQPSPQLVKQVSEQEGVQVYDMIPLEHEVLARLLEFCQTPKSAAQIKDFIAPISRQTLRNRILRPCLKHGLLHMTVPEKPTSSRQKYVSMPHTLPALVQPSPQLLKQDDVQVDNESDF